MERAIQHLLIPSPMKNLCKIEAGVSWTLQLVAAVILGQTLFFKFSGAEESRYIFSILGMEPWGRWGTGGAELIAVILLLIPRTAAVGAFLSLGLMTGAIASHLTKLGIVVKDDGGLLFILAVTVFVSSGVILFLRRRQLPIVGDWLQHSHEGECASAVDAR